MNAKQLLQKQFTKLQADVEDINKKIKKFPYQVIDYLEGYCEENFEVNELIDVEKNYKRGETIWDRINGTINQREVLMNNTLEMKEMIANINKQMDQLIERLDEDFISLNKRNNETIVLLRDLEKKRAEQKIQQQHQMISYLH